MWPTWRKFQALAVSQLGVKESPAGSNRQKYGTAFLANGQAWCAWFFCWLLLKLGALGLIGGADGYTPSLAKWFHDHHMWSEKPGVGYIPFFAFYGPNYQGRWRGIHHVGGGGVQFIKPDGTLGTIEGNTSVSSNDNGGIVMRRLRNPANVAGYAVLPWAKEKPSASLTPGNPLYHTRAVMRHDSQLWNGTIGTKRNPSPKSGGIVTITGPNVTMHGVKYTPVSWGGNPGGGWVRYDDIKYI